MKSFKEAEKSKEMDVLNQMKKHLSQFNVRKQTKNDHEVKSPAKLAPIKMKGATMVQNARFKAFVRALNNSAKQIDVENLA